MIAVVNDAMLREAALDAHHKAMHLIEGWENIEDFDTYVDALAEHGVDWIRAGWKGADGYTIARAVCAALPDDESLDGYRARLERLIAQADGQLSLF